MSAGALCFYALLELRNVYVPRYRYINHIAVVNLVCQRTFYNW